MSMHTSANEQALRWRQHDLIVQEEQLLLDLSTTRADAVRYDYEPRIPATNTVFGCKISENGDICIYYTYRIKHRLFLSCCCEPCVLLGETRSLCPLGYGEDCCCCYPLFSNLWELLTLCIQPDPRKRAYRRNNRSFSALMSEHTCVWKHSEQRWNYHVWRSDDEISDEPREHGDMHKALEPLCRMHLEKNNYIDTTGLYAFGCSKEKVVCVPYDQNKLFIITLGVVRALRIPHKLYDCFIEFE